ncbi:hypothetical protein [Lacticaseibacillus camelliae]|uniref:Uncharacterized protein n=1 Tax=Lacticaseibacillus camelliae DSM 22697 = JCM 13995 TaxID=1423730 RepID=A0A0R2F9D6_9LACO|nr:hypothetical protein [Lacticaseibacillus camelliae]KRN23045.1 hypothetical protein FC75_GL001685 [Lacticaseibacillus camelliae DSM 22697 = JCM 13995]
MPKVELMLSEWNALAPERQRFIASQLSRYFLSPLLSVDAIMPVAVDYFGNHLNTFDILIGGEWLRFIPGMRHVALGVKQPIPAEMQGTLNALGVSKTTAQQHLSPAAVRDMPPMLVARTSVNTGEEVIGTIDLTTQVFSGDHFAYVPIKNQVLALLRPKAAGLTPTRADAFAPRLENATVVLRLAGEHTYQVAVKRDWDQAGLVKRLSGFGFALPDEREYEYLMGGGLDSLFGWGNRLPEAGMRYVPNRFGLTVPVARKGAELVRSAFAKSAAVSAGATVQALLPLSQFYRTRPGAFKTMRYRKIAKVELQ